MAKVTSTPTYDDVNLLLRLYELRREDRMRKARAWFAGSFRPTTMEELSRTCPPGSEENASFRMVTSYWEMVASFVTSGVLNPSLFFESNSELLLVWVRLETILPLLRDFRKDPLYFRNLESVAVDFAAWMNRRAPGSYEAFAERIRNLR